MTPAGRICASLLAGAGASVGRPVLPNSHGDRSPSPHGHGGGAGRSLSPRSLHPSPVTLSAALPRPRHPAVSVPYFIRPSSPPRGLQSPTTGALWSSDPSQPHPGLPPIPASELRQGSDQGPSPARVPCPTCQCISRLCHPAAPLSGPRSPSLQNGKNRRPQQPLAESPQPSPQPWPRPSSLPQRQNFGGGRRHPPEACSSRPWQPAPGSL